ncbi:putative disease resistance protein RGA1 [Salvia hispanica]|uniref:putative disease resistance protein RGA1 n=1 Tax=Salvia hispanica TaxID=49212 RepID=UPI0020094729|nr:putative disease resistance protein RGA1 [Salvia hispanica]
MATALYRASIEVLVQNLINYCSGEYPLLRGVDKEAQQLQRTLGMIQACLIDAEEKSITRNDVKIWLEELETMAFDADNVLDELNYHLLHKQVKIPSLSPKVLPRFSSFNRISLQRNIARKIKKITADFKSMNERAIDLGIQSIVLNASAVDAHISTKTASISLDPIFVGRDDDVHKLVDMLTQTQEDQIFSIVALLGRGGVGKTTVTRKVLNHERINARFESLIYITVSKTFHPIILFNKILSSLTSHTRDGFESGDVILKRLQEALKAKTYLLVLDDVWNEDVPNWNGFINSMSEVTSTNGNAIIITTRNAKVASIVNPFHIHRLSGLSIDDCWSIIKARTFDENGEVPSSFEMVGRNIAKKCHGLPLATNIIGGVLRYKSEEEWRLIYEKWLSVDEGYEHIIRILKLSFDHLTSSLKKCFAYCSIFPKDWRIVKEELIELWMAEGFLQTSQKDDMEFAGTMIFNVLLQNSLLQVVWKGNHGQEYYGMHDLVHDIASFVLYERGGRFRYMFLNEESSPIPKEGWRNLRTLFLGGGVSCTMFSDFKCLHNLTLIGSNYKELSNSIRELIHLRNLNISRTSIGNLPEWIGELHCLQTLRAETSYLKKLPSTLKYLIELRHLYITRDTELPAEIGRLISLRTLPHFTVGKEKDYGIKELGNLKNLKGRLVIEHLERVRDKEEAQGAKINQNPNLTALQFEWNDGGKDGRNDESVLEGLQPHANLKKLMIVGYKGKIFPTWFKNRWIPLENLIELKIYNCSECQEIPRLDHLLNLKTLHLIGLDKVRFIDSSNKKLTSLRIIELERLESICIWLFYDNHNISTCIELPDSPSELIIKYCPNLKWIVDPLELWVPTIERLELEGLPRLEDLPTLIYNLTRSSPRLKYLIILGVPIFMLSVSVQSWDLGKLKELHIDVSVQWSTENSGAIEYAVDGILQGCCNSLTLLKLRGVGNWDWVPMSIQHLNVLSSLVLDSFGVEELPHWFGNLSSLVELNLSNCQKLKCLPSCLTKLRYLTVEDCTELRIDSEWYNIPHLIIHVCNSMDASITILPDVEPQEENVAENFVQSLERESRSVTEAKLDMQILIEESSDMSDGVVSAAYSNPPSVSGHEIKRQSAHEIEEEGVVLEQSKTEMSMSNFTSPHRVEPECHGEIQAVNEQQKTGTIIFPAKECYVFAIEGKHLKLKFDNQNILVGDYPSLSPHVRNLFDKELHELSSESDYADSLILFLQRNTRLTLIQPSFFDNMPDLVFLDLSDTKIKILPSSLFELSELKVLLLRNCICLEKLQPEIGELEKMEVLDLSGTELYDLPAEISKLVNMKRMHLSFYGPEDESEYEHLPCQLVSPSFLSNMKGIESLSISVHPEDQRWTKLVASIINDISELEMLSSLHFYFPQIETFENFAKMSPSWNDRESFSFDFTVGQDVKRINSRVPDEVESLFSQQERCFRYVNGDKTSPLVKGVITRATAFYLDHHTYVRSLSEFDISSFRSLEFCVVRECPKMQTIMDEEKAEDAFPCLKSLRIYFVWELKQIWKPPSQARRLNRIFKTPVPVRNFKSLKHLTVKTCPKLQFIFWESMLQCLDILEELIVDDCEVMEKIIKEESKNVKYQHNVLPRLTKLVLAYLPELVRVGCGVPVLEENVYGCPKLNRA